MHKIFLETANKNYEIEPNYLDLSEERTIALTYDNNLVYFDSKTNSLGCYGLLG